MDRINKLKDINPWSALVVFVLFLLLVEYVELDVGLRSRLEKISGPLLGTGSNVGFILKSPYLIFSNAYNASKKIQDLEIRYSESLAKIGQLEALQAENKSLREIIENTDRIIGKSIVSSTIVSYGDPYIDRGKDDGVEVGDLVMSAQTLIGLIAQVSPHQAKVNLLYQLSSGGLIVKNEANAQGILVGDGKKIVIKDISKNDPLSVGDRIMTVGQKGVDGELFIGKVSFIVDQQEAATKEAYVEQVVNFYETRIVEVRKK